MSLNGRTDGSYCPQQQLEVAVMLRPFILVHTEGLPFDVKVSIYNHGRYFVKVVANEFLEDLLKLRKCSER